MAFNQKLEEIKSHLLGQVEGWGIEGNDLAVTAAREVGFPGAKAEEWKYSPLPIAPQQRFELKGQSKGLQLEHADFPVSGLCELVFVDGRFEPALSDSLPTGARIEPGFEEGMSGFEDLLLSHLNDATAPTLGVVITVDAGAIIEPFILIRFLHTDTEAASWTQSRIQVKVGSGAEVSFMECADPDVLQRMLNSVAEIQVEAEANVHWLNLEEVPESWIQVNQTRVSVAQKARFEHIAISTGEGYVRNNLEIKITGEEGDAHMYGLSLGSQKFHVDHHTFVNHKPENTTSNQLYKGIFSGKSKGVFNGKILVDQVAQKTNAYQSSKNILLSTDAGVFAKPQLEIFADDVKCSHGATIGQLDEEPIFYLRSRGLDLNTARMLLIQAFASEVLMKIEHPAIHAWVEEKVLNRMDLMLAENKA